MSRLKANKSSKRGMNFCVIVPNNIEHAIELDQTNGNYLWKSDIEKEVSKVKAAFMLLNDDEKPPIGREEIKYHMILTLNSTLQEKQGWWQLDI